MSEEVRLPVVSRRRLFWLLAMSAAIAAPASMLLMSGARAQSDQAPAAEPSAPKKKAKAKTTTKTKTGDFYKTRATIPAAEAFRPLQDGGRPLVNG
jgi:hypothetical protein